MPRRLRRPSPRLKPPSSGRHFVLAFAIKSRLLLLLRVDRAQCSSSSSKPASKEELQHKLPPEPLFARTPCCSDYTRIPNQTEKATATADGSSEGWGCPLMLGMEDNSSTHSADDDQAQREPPFGRAAQRCQQLLHRHAASSCQALSIAKDTALPLRRHRHQHQAS
ncbi:unnamed protein product [Lampetra planeri]